MSKTTHCPLCKKNNYTELYSVQDAPLFQNKVYEDVLQAKNVATAMISLVACDDCGFVFNHSFDPELMIYDAGYENEQAHSGFFQDYLSSIITLFNPYKHQKIIEIGCGKGFFLEKLKSAGFDIRGFDPAYTGDNPAIIKDYFSEKYTELSGEVIILRHVLEHVQYPFDFLHQIAKASGYKGKIYIEVPALEWIVENKAFWDIFYEHCNYFSLNDFQGMFEQLEYGLLFNDQYRYVFADLKDLKNLNNKSEVTNTNHLLKKQLGEFKQLLNHYDELIQKKSGIALWGAGAKGVTFANLIDPEAKWISCLIDINPKKQKNFIAKTAHQVISPDKMSQWGLKNILVMNNNYLVEIQKIVAPLGIAVSCLH